MGLKIKRLAKHATQKVLRGFTDEDMWNLDVTFAKFALPRLKRYAEAGQTHPCDLSETEWDIVLSRMIDSFEHIAGEDYMGGDVVPEYVQEGLDLFARYFMALWW